MSSLITGNAVPADFSDESRFQAILDSSIEPLLIADDSRRYLDGNEAGCELLGVERAEIRNFRIDDFSLPGHEAAIDSAWQTFLNSGEQRGEFQLVRRDGTTRIVEFSAKANFMPGRHLSSLRDITDRIQIEESLRALSGRLLTIQDDERRRIARELHDSTGQSLAVSKMMVSTIEKRLLNADGYSDLREMCSDVLKSLDECSKEIRTLSYLLHPPLLDETGLPSAVRWYAQGFAQRSGMDVKVDISSNVGRLPIESETALFRVIQESLTNVHRHAQSPSVEIKLARIADEVLLEVIDQGKGMSSSTGIGAKQTVIGVGISGMRERLRQLDGQLSVTSSPRGTTIKAVVPVFAATKKVNADGSLPDTLGKGHASGLTSD